MTNFDNRKISSARAEATPAGDAFESRSEKAPFLTVERYSVYAHRLLLLYCLIAALSIAAAQTILLALIALWLACAASGAFRRAGAAAEQDRFTLRLLAAPMTAWFLVEAVTAVCGIDPQRSLFELLKSSVFLLLPYAVFYSFTAPGPHRRELLGKLETYMAGLLLGQSIAATHTVLSELLNYDLPAIVPGAVTESGQLVLVIPLVLASAFYALTSESLKDNLHVSIFSLRIPPQLYAGILFTILLIIAWPGALLFEDAGAGTAVFRLLGLAGLLLLAIPPLRRGAPGMKEKLGSAGSALHVDLIQLVWPASALLFAALLINLKRGPWLGVFVELFVLGFFLSKRLLCWSVALSCLVILTLSPARSRVETLDEHFSITGGRQEMWNLGFEIVQRHPLGVGLHNARYMRELDPAIPSTHRHMHNNFLNVAVETGWLGLAVYLWWIGAMLGLGLGMWRVSRTTKDRLARQVGVIALCLAIGLLGWQVAGTVEYNFGDGEIRLIALLYMGLLLSIKRFLVTS